MLVGTEAPKFTAKAVVKNKICDNFSISDFFGKKYVVLFFYPLDFTFVCPTELHAFQEKLEEFEKRNAQVVGCSVDSCFAHCAWLNTPKTKGGIEGITYPIISDLNKEIARSFAVLREEAGIAYRGIFLIDKGGIVRYEAVHDPALGRSVDETLRVVDALIFYERHGDVCPANWKPGDKAVTPSEQGLSNYFS